MRSLQNVTLHLKTLKSFPLISNTVILNHSRSEAIFLESFLRMCLRSAFFPVSSYAIHAEQAYFLPS